MTAPEAIVAPADRHRAPDLAQRHPSDQRNRLLPTPHRPPPLAPTSRLRRRQDASPPARTSTKTLIPTNGTAILAPMGLRRGDGRRNFCSPTPTTVSINCAYPSLHRAYRRRTAS